MKNLCTLIASILFVVNASAQNTKETYHRAKIYFNTSEDIENLRQAGIAMDHGFKKENTYFESDFSTSELQRIEALGYQTKITIQDIGAFYKNQNDPNHKDYVGPVQSRNATCATSDTDYQTPVNFNVFPANQYGGFYTYSQVLQELTDMATLYPNLITVQQNISTFLTDGQVDNSVSPSIGGNGIKWVKISDNPNTDEAEPEVLYTSIHHAREPASLSQLIFYMWYLLENYDTDPEIQSIVDNTELYFVPVVNPDGYLHNESTDPQGGGFWRKNRFNGHGVDNNRNYNYFIDGDPNNGSWGGAGSSGNTGSSIYRGSAPFSEVENQAIKWFVEQHDFVLALNNHTFGELLYYPFGYADVATPDEGIFQGITSQLTSVNGYSPLRDNPFSGDSDDYMYGTVGTHNKIFSMTPEVGNSFWPAQTSIEGVCKDMVFLNITAAQLAGNYATIEDASSNFIETTSTNVSYNIQRLGLEDPANFTVSINPITANIISTGATNAHNGVLYLQEITDDISLNLDSNINVGDTITYELIINNGLYNRTVTVDKIFGQPTTLLDEMGDNVTTNWTTSSWSDTTEDFSPGSASSSITDSPNSNYSSNQNTTIALTNPIDLNGASTAILNFFAKWNIENNFDYVQIEVSTNNGTNWIPQCGKFTNTGVANQAGANNQPLYDGVQNDWVLETIDLSDYLDEMILIRFQLVTDGGVNRDGFYFDDLQIKTLQDNLSNEEFNINTFAVFPNPVDNQLNIQTLESDYDVNIYNIQGQLVFSLKSNSGNTTLDYSDYAQGLYLLEVKSKSRNKTFKIVKR